MTRHRSAFTVLELVVTILAIGVVIVLGFVLTSVYWYARESAAQMADGAQVRDVQKAMNLWANDNQGLYPLPSVIDALDATLAAPPKAKDTTANILSLIVYTGYVTPSFLVSVAESNTAAIMQDHDYMYDRPASAVDPANALWDPAFAADFTNGKVGNTSYAHVLPGGGREALWRDTFVTTEPIVGNRGPQVTGVDASGSPTFALAASKTFLIHGSRNGWSGNIAYNDGHVVFHHRTNPDGLTYHNAANTKLPDNLFFDEPEDATGHNAWMSIWTTAGTTKAEFTPIWD